LDTRLDANGTLSPFIVPAGQVLVISSFEARLTGPPGGGATAYVYASAAGGRLAETSEVTFDATGFAKAVRDLAAPVVVKGGLVPCSGSNANILEAQVTGFLATDR
jgi:hypothetical protein